MRRPSATPSASTSRSFSSRTTSAASLATSVAESTEMPTSAACRASASLTPSPRKATSPPARRWARTMRAFCSGLTRAKTVVVGRSPRRARCRRAASRSVPVSVAGRRQAEVAADLGGDRRVVAGDDLDGDAEAGEPGQRSRAASGLGGSRKTRKPASARSRSSAAVSAVSSGAGRLATATTRLPAANSAVEHRRGGGRARRGSGQHRLRRALGDQRSGPSGPSTSTRDQPPLVVEGQHAPAAGSRRPAVAGGRGACHSARSSGLPPTARRRRGRLGGEQPEPQRRVVGAAVGVERLA